MFDRVSAPELIPSVLEKFVRVYIQEQNLQEEELLLLYIEVTFSLTFKVFISCYVTVCMQTDTVHAWRPETGWGTQFFLLPHRSGSLTWVISLETSAFTC